MNQPLPSVTVLIAARPDQVEIKARDAAQRLEYPADKLEIIIARGKHPSVQRNAALRAARGDLIYFLDDDSTPPPANLRVAAEAFADASVKMLGGPNLCPPDAPFLEQVFAAVHASFAFGSSRARYWPVGKRRPASEKELILCNLLARRGDLLDLGGFNEALYPNEENALMDELQKRGGTLLYDPELIVHRRPRHSLGAFCRMLLNYGRGRAEQFRLHPTLGSAPNFVPPLFCLYLLALLVLTGLAAGKMVALPAWVVGGMLVPLGVYALAALTQTAFLIAQFDVGRGICALPLLVLTHILYGLGFWKGLRTRLKDAPERPKIEVRLETIRPAG